MREMVLGGGGIRSSLLFGAAAASRDGRVAVFLSSVHLDVVIDGVRRTIPSSRLEGATRSCAVSPDGRFIACAGSAVVLIDPTTLDPLRSVPLSAFCVAFSPDGALLACGDKVVSLVDVTNGAVVRELRGSRRAITSLAFDKTGARIACGGDTKIRVFDVARGKKLHELDAQPHVECAFAGDSLVTAGPRSRVSLWDLASGARRDVEPELWAASALTALGDGTVAMCTVVERDIELRILGGGEWLVRESLSEVSGARAIVRRGEDLVILGDGEPAAEVHRHGAIVACPGHTDQITTLASKGRLLASGSRDGTTIVWDLAKKSPGARIVIPNAIWSGLRGRDKPSALAFSADGQRLAIGTEGGRVAIATIEGTLEHVFAAQDVGAVTAVAFSNDGTWIASTNGRIMNNVPKLRVHSLAGELIADLRSEYFARELRFVEDGAVEILTVQACARAGLSQDAVGPFRNHDLDHVVGRAHAASADGTTIADGGGKELYVWSTATGRTSLRLERGEIVQLALSADGSRLAIAEWGRESIEIVGRDGQVIATAPWGSWIPPSVLAFGDDRTLFAGAEDGTIVAFPI
ncbi:MAG: WD40 repeat domain-containing protein [Polyangiales bacterium]